MHVKPKHSRIAELARKYRGEPLVSIHHYMDKWWLQDAYHQLDGSKAPGIDRVTKDQYGVSLAENLEDLIDRVRSKTYWAPPVKRVEIPKGDSEEMRQLGLLCFEDKVLQKAFVMLTQPVFEEAFYEFSYGFRPGRNPHQALKSLFRAIGWKGKWIIDLDIRKFFDTIDHLQLREFFSKRIKDGVLNRLVLGWLKAGVLEQEHWQMSEAGTPQGGNASPLLANLYLHEVLDDWFVKEVQPRLKSNGGMVRYADDAVLYFDNEEDAQRVMAVLGSRLEKFGLSLHPEKTKLINFRQPHGKEKRETFQFLGFTFYWGTSRKGKRIIKLKTASKRQSAKMKSLYDWIKENRHLPRRKQHAMLSAKLRGLYQYYGVNHNIASLSKLHFYTVCSWRKWLNRTGRKKPMSWSQFGNYLEAHPLPFPKIVHDFF